MDFVAETMGRGFSGETETTARPLVCMILDSENRASVDRRFFSVWTPDAPRDSPWRVEAAGDQVAAWPPTAHDRGEPPDTWCVVSSDAASLHGVLADATLEYWKESTDQATRVANAGSAEEIVSVLRRCGLDSIGSRIGYLRQLRDDDPDEPQLRLDSLKHLALFLVGERQLGSPQIGVDPDGLAHAEWRTAGGGLLAMEFMPSGMVRFAAVSGPAPDGAGRRRVNGELTKEEAVDAVRPFFGDGETA